MRTLLLFPDPDNEWSVIQLHQRFLLVNEHAFDNAKEFIAQYLQVIDLVPGTHTFYLALADQ